MKRYIVERTNKAELRPKEQSEKAASCRENVRNEIPGERVIKAETDTKTEFKKWASSVGLCPGHKTQRPHHVKVCPRGPNNGQITDLSRIIIAEKEYGR